MCDIDDMLSSLQTKTISKNIIWKPENKSASSFLVDIDDFKIRLISMDYVTGKKIGLEILKKSEDIRINITSAPDGGHIDKQLIHLADLVYYQYIHGIVQLMDTSGENKESVMDVLSDDGFENSSKVKGIHIKTGEYVFENEVDRGEVDLKDVINIQ